MDQKTQSQGQGSSYEVEQIVQRLEALKNRTQGKTDVNAEIDQIAQAVRQLAQEQSGSSSSRPTEHSRS